MAKSNFFFKRQEFVPPGIRQPYYTYLGYLIEGREYPYPISIYFGKDEIAVYYTKDDNQVLKIFSLYVAEGTINQNMLAKKVEDYAVMPLWPLSVNLFRDEPGTPQSDKTQGNKPERLCVDPVLLRTGFFPSYYGFEFSGNGFSKINLPGSCSGIVHIKDNNALEFEYEKRRVGDGELPKDTWWTVNDNDVIHAKRISFSKILLDFLFELDFANTFEDENFFHLQPHLQNNFVLDALTKKCRYLSELNKRRSFSQQKRNEQLPKPFQDDEKAWLNVCRLENYKPVFTSPNSLFDDPETEVKNICFKARIGEGRKKRKEYLKSKEDAQFKNEICTFFMRKYDIWSAFRVLMPAWAIVFVPFILLTVPLGDYFLAMQSEKFVGVSSIGLPMAIFFFVFAYHISKGINLFKLLLPRLFLGIMLGWSIFWSTEELWKRALTTHATTVLIFDLFLLVIIFMYIFTDISNRMYRKADWRVALKSVNLIVMALVLSFVIGFYVIQFFAEPMIENSGFLEDERVYNRLPTKDQENDSPNSRENNAAVYPEKMQLSEFFNGNAIRNGTPWNWDIHDYVEYLIGMDDSKGKDDDSGIRTYHSHSIGIFKGKRKPSIIYIWSILFSQFVVSILIGVVLQLLWEDRAITEPL